MTLLPSRFPSLLPLPGTPLTTLGSGLRSVLTSVLDAARSLVDRLPGEPTGSRPAGDPLGTDRRRRHGSQASRSLAR
jgi:hypothetical protein